MASLTKKLKTKRRARRKKAGRTRKSKMAIKSTLSYDELFEGFGEVGKKAPALKKD
ncbi:MAG: hypothetical protein PF689_13855 [Deltaproteobacteria bacterium]|jgi:hypothetical protein|nr:hypothetical protein [Deltaproteobacteria bacterium]